MKASVAGLILGVVGILALLWDAFIEGLVLRHEPSAITVIILGCTLLGVTLFAVFGVIHLISDGDK